MSSTIASAGLPSDPNSSANLSAEKKSAAKFFIAGRDLNDTKRITWQMLAPEMTLKSNWEGEIEANGIAFGKRMLNYVKDCEYFDAQYADAFSGAYDILEDTREFFEKEKKIQLLEETFQSEQGSILGALQSGREYKYFTKTYQQNARTGKMEYKEAAIEEIITRVSGKIMEEIVAMLKKHTDEVAAAYKEREGQTGWGVNYDSLGPSLRAGGWFVGYQRDRGEICDEFKDFFDKNSEKIKKEMTDIFHRYLVEEAYGDAELKDRFMVPCGFYFKNGFTSCQGHQTFIYFKKIEEDLWQVQEVNFGDGMPDPIHDSNYRKLTTFGRYLCLNKNKLKEFLTDVYIVRSAENTCDNASKKYRAIWKKYEDDLKFSQKEQPHGPTAPWHVVSNKDAQRAGNCVMRSIEGLEEVILLDYFNEIDGKNESHVSDNSLNENSEISKRRSNTITLKCYEAVSRLAVLTAYFDVAKSNNKSDRDDFGQLKSSLEHLGAKILAISKKIEKYGDQVKMPYLAGNFLERLNANYMNLHNEIIEYVESDKSKKILYEAKLNKKDEECTYFKECKYDSQFNECSAGRLAKLHQRFAIPSCEKAEFRAVNVTNFEKIKNCDCDYIASELKSLLECVRKNEKCAKFVARKMMKIIQNIPFNHDNLLALSLRDSANLMDQMRRCLAVIDTHCSAYDFFYQAEKPTYYQKDGHYIQCEVQKKNIDWQLRDEKMNFREYDLTKVVNAHAVASIIMTRIISKNTNVFSEKRGSCLEKFAFDFSQYLAYYNSLSCYIHSPKDAEIMRSIVAYIESKKEGKNKKTTVSFISNQLEFHMRNSFCDCARMEVIDRLINSTDFSNEIRKTIYEELGKLKNPKVKFNEMYFLLFFACSIPQFRAPLFVARDSDKYDDVFDERKIVVNKDELFRRVAMQQKFGTYASASDLHCFSNAREASARARQKINEVFSEKISNGDANRADCAIMILLSLFDILSDGIPVKGYSDMLMQECTLKTEAGVCFPDSLSESSDAISMLLNCDSENEIRNSSEFCKDILPLICIDCLNEDTKTVNLIHRLRRNLDICNAFGTVNESEEKIDAGGAPTKKSNYYLMHFFEQMIQHTSRKSELKKGSDSLTQLGNKLNSPRPIEENAKNNYNELIDAVNALEMDGIQKFYAAVPVSQIRVSSLAMVMHYKSLVLRNIIAQHRDDENIYKMLSRTLANQMKKIEELEKNTMHLVNGDSNIKYYIAIMKNECILNMLELNSVEESGELNLKNWQTPVDAKYVEELVLNSYMLRGFDPNGLTKGCLYAANDAHETLEYYWAAHPAIAEGIARKMCDHFGFVISNFTQYDESNSKAIFQCGDTVVDLLTLSIYRENKLVGTCDSDLLNNGDIKHLFRNRQLDIIGNDNLCFCKDESYGSIEINRIKKGEVSIFCDLDSDGNQWLYLGRDAIRDVCYLPESPLAYMPEYFLCDKFNIFIGKKGEIRIYEDGISKKLLFETVEVEISGKKTWALKSNRTQDNGCFVAFHGDSPFRSKVLNNFEGTSLSNFENERCIGVLYDGNGKITRIFFPRLVDSNGNEVALVAFEESDGTYSWRWNSNMSYKLCQGIATPLLDSFGKPMENSGYIYNPFIAFNNYLCFENVDSNSMKSYKFLIPGGEYYRRIGLSHNYVFSFTGPVRAQGPFYKSVCVGEVSYGYDPLIFLEKPMTGNTPLGTLRIARAFQIQGQYEEAMKYLNFLSANGPISDDELMVFRDMMAWFADGSERSPQCANFVLMAIGRMLQWGSNSPNVKELLKDMLKWQSNGKPCQDGKYNGKFFLELIQSYLSGYDVYSTAARMSLDEEEFLWGSIELCLGDSIPGDTCKQIHAHLVVLKKVRDKELNSREKVKEYFAEEKHAQKDEVHYFLRESEKLQAKLTDCAQSNGAALDEKFSSCNTVEADVVEMAKKTFKVKINDGDGEGNIFDSPDESNSPAPHYDIAEGIDSSEGIEAQEDMKSFEEEMNLGAQEQAKRQNDPFLKEDFFRNIGEDEVTNFVAFLEVQRSNLCDVIPEFLSEISNLLYAGKYESTFGAGKWRSANISEVIHHIFGYYAGGHRKKALDYIHGNNPSFKAENLDRLNELIENYISRINSMRHIQKTMDALNAFVKNKNGITWGMAASLIRSFRDSQLGKFDKTESGMHRKMIHRFSLILEMMSQIRLRPDQIEKIYFIFQAVQNGNKSGDEIATGALIQQLMGSGKSKALIPALVLMGLYMRKKRENDSDSHYFGYPVIVSHSTQLSSVIKELPAIFSELKIGVEAIKLDFQSLRSVKGMQFFRRKLKNMMKKRTHIPVFTSSDLMALLTLFNSYEANSDEGMEKYLSEYLEVMKLLKKCTGIFDEIHLTANPKEAFIVEAAPNGEKNIKSIEKNEINAVTDFIFNYLPKELLAACRCNQQSLIAQQELHNQLKKAIRNKLNAMKLSSENAKMLSEDDEELLIKFMAGELDGLSENDLSVEAQQERIHHIIEQFGSDQLKSILALRAMVTHFIPHCFQKVYNKDFGYDPETGNVVPYANSKPSMSKFQNPWEIICFSCLSAMVEGFSKKAISEFIIEFNIQMHREVAAGIKLNLSKSNKLFKEYFKHCQFGEDVIDLANIVKTDDRGNPYIPNDILEAIGQYAQTQEGHAVTIALIREICMNAAVWNPSSYGTSPSAIIENVFQSAIGATGTTYNRSAFPLCMKDNYSPQQGSLGAVCSKFVENNENKRSHIHAIAPETMIDEGEETSNDEPILTAKKLLQQWTKDIRRAHENGADASVNAEAMIKNLRIIVDSGCFLVSQEIRDVICDIAEFIRSAELDVTHIEWYDPQAKAFVIAEVWNILESENRNFPITVLNDAENQRPKSRDKIFTFLDAGHSVGSDPAMKQDGHGLMTANLHNMEMGAFTQSIMRERHFLGGPGQKMDLIVRKDALSEIEPTAKNDSDGTNFYGGSRQKELSISIIKHLVNNTTHDTIRQRARAVQIQLHELIVMIIKGWLVDDIENEGSKNQIELRKCFSEFLIEEKLFELNNWKYLQCLKSVRGVVGNDFARKMQRMTEILEKLKGKFSEEKYGKMQGDIEKINARAIESMDRIPEDEKFLVPLGSSGSEDFGHTDAILEEMQEAHVEVSVQQEQNEEMSVMQFVELENIMQEGNCNDRAISRNPTCLFEHLSQRESNQCNAYEYLQKQWSGDGEDSNLQTLAAHFHKFAGDGSQSMGLSKIKEEFSAFEKFFQNPFFNSFYYSKNFLQATKAELSVFHKSQICADDVLIVWNEDASDIKCVFVAKNDLSEIKKLIECGRLTNCYLATAYGNAHANTRAKLDAKVIEFLNDVKWMSNFFNGEIAELLKNEDKTCEILHGMGNFNEHSDAVHKFLMIRSNDAQECRKKIQNAEILCNEKVGNSILANAYAGLCAQGDEIVKMNINQFFDEVFSESGKGSISANVLKTVLKYGKKHINDNKKLTALMNRINSSESNRQDLIKDILAQFSDEEILSLLLRRNESSLKFLIEICTFILNNDSARIEDIRDPNMVALLTLISNEGNDQLRHPSLIDFIEILDPYEFNNLKELYAKFIHGISVDKEMSSAINCEIVEKLFNVTFGNDSNYNRQSKSCKQSNFNYVCAFLLCKMQKQQILDFILSVTSESEVNTMLICLKNNIIINTLNDLSPDDLTKLLNKYQNNPLLISKLLRTICERKDMEKFVSKEFAEEFLKAFDVKFSQKPEEKQMNFFFKNQNLLTAQLGLLDCCDGEISKMFRQKYFDLLNKAASANTQISEEIQVENDDWQIDRKNSQVNEEWMQIKNENTQNQSPIKVAISSVALIKKAKQGQYLVVGLAIATVVSILVALLLLFGVFGSGILAAIAVPFGLIAAKIVIFGPGVVFLICTGLAYARVIISPQKEPMALEA
ncbi:MAG: hypothetical protein LBI69_02635 [Puniceicoccales bacterium]|jgi:hypothetical protein|nr:hypothetical protein [Puniceicoccales bacterium]